MENIISGLNEFKAAKQLAIDSGRDCVVETVDDEGTHNYIVCHSKFIKDHLEHAERITIIKDGKDFEFVSCQ